MPISRTKIYLMESEEWPASVISEDHIMIPRMKALDEGNYGRCVYKCDNDVLDQQVVSMCDFTIDISRTIKLMGTKGEIMGHMEKNERTVTNFLDNSSEIVELDQIDGHIGSGGGDLRLVDKLVERVNKFYTKGYLTTSDEAVESHLIAFAAEKSRLENKRYNLIVLNHHCIFLWS